MTKGETYEQDEDHALSSKVGWAEKSSMYEGGEAARGERDLATSACGEWQPISDYEKNTFVMRNSEGKGVCLWWITNDSKTGCVCG